jgi:hypothetical protein
MLAAKFGVIFLHLDERQRRLLMGAEAGRWGHSGIRLVVRAAGVRKATVSLGVTELDSGAKPLGRVRRLGGGGRKRATEVDPVSPLRWTAKSIWGLAAEMTPRGRRSPRTLSVTWLIT